MSQNNSDIHMNLKMSAVSYAGIEQLADGRQIDETQILPLCDFVDQRFDCSDFRVVVLLKTLYAFSHLLSDNTKNRIKQTILNFKYWIDEPGEDSMCYWSENHQLLFHSCEYMAGSLYPNEIFPNANMTGQEHASKAKPKILQWLKHKWDYGFIEWHSNTYYEEDIAPLSLLIDHAPNPEIRRKSSLIIDLLLLDMAIFSFDGYFSSTSGRCYEAQKKDGTKQDTLNIYRHAFGDTGTFRDASATDDVTASNGATATNDATATDDATDAFGSASASDDVMPEPARDPKAQPSATYNYEKISALFLVCTNYQVPAVIKAIAADKGSRICKDSPGFELKELKRRFVKRQSTNQPKKQKSQGLQKTQQSTPQLRKQKSRVRGLRRHRFPSLTQGEREALVWQMESFTNPQTVNLTIDLFRRWKLHTNVFLQDLSMISNPFLRKSRILPLLVKILNPATAGTAIQRSHNYCYKTANYMLTTAMSHYPGTFGDQQHIWHAALPNNIQIFATHPGAPLFDDQARNFSPDYWVGNGILPDCAQHESTFLGLYQCTQRKGFLERDRLAMSHMHFPKNRFDEVVVQPKAVFGRIGTTYIVVLGAHPLTWKGSEDLIQQGKHTAWVCKLSSQNESGSFADFIQQVRETPCLFAKNRVLFGELSLTYKGDFTVKGKTVETTYLRLDTPYVRAERKDPTITIKWQGLTQNLRFEQ